MSDETEAATDATPKKKKGKGKLILIAAACWRWSAAARAAPMRSAISAAAVPRPRPKTAGSKLVPKSEQKRGGGGEGKEGEGGGAAARRRRPGRAATNTRPTITRSTRTSPRTCRTASHFVQVGIAVSTPYDETVIENLKTNEIAVRSAILMALGDTTEEEVFTADGKKQLPAAAGRRRSTRR